MDSTDEGHRCRLEGTREDIHAGKGGKVFVPDKEAELTADQVEALFCLAVIPEGPDAVQRIMSRFIEFRDNPSPTVLEWLSRRAKVKQASPGDPWSDLTDRKRTRSVTSLEEDGVRGL